jgi:hypothetical protein
MRISLPGAGKTNIEKRACDERNSDIACGAVGPTHSQPLLSVCRRTKVRSLHVVSGRVRARWDAKERYGYW